MGTEYYLIKPDKQEVFYLGKHAHCPEGIKDATYGHTEHFIDYHSFTEFLLDYIDANHWEFADEMTWGELNKEAYNIYKWCSYDKVLFAHDCMEDAEEWLNWKETGSVLELKNMEDFE